MKNTESWYWHNLNVATALILLVAMIALCSLLAPDRPKATVYQNDNLTIQCIEKKAGACERVTVKDKGVKNEANNR